MGHDAASSFPDARDHGLVEGFARVVALEGDHVLAEPEQFSGCAGCHSAGLCAIGKDGGSARRLAAKRFRLPGDLGLAVGERVVVGVSEGTLLRGAATAYGLPLLTLLAGGLAGQELGGSDARAAMGAVAGLAVGLGLARLVANMLSARGALTPRFLRRASGRPLDAACHTEHG